MKEDFVHLHVHSDYSQLDGCGKVSNYVQAAKEMGQPAIALTEHGTMRSYHTLLEECQKSDIKPVYGIEFYVAKNMHRKGMTDDEKKEITHGMKMSECKVAIKEFEEREGIRDRWHITVWAQNEVGLKNLFALSSKAWLDGFYYKPRIDVEELIKHKDGLIVATGCQSSVVMDHICYGRRKKALFEADRLYEAFGEKLWLEVMPHAGSDQIASNKFAIELMARWGDKVKLVATQDAHYVDASDSEAHEVLLCIGTGDSMKNPDRFRFGDGELYLKSRKQMREDFLKNHGYMGKKSIKESLDNTLEVTKLIQDEIIKIDRFACLMPPIDIPSEYGGDAFAFTKALCIHGWTWREMPKRAKAYAKRHGITYEESLTIYKTRLKMELGQIKRQKFIPYFLLIRDLYNWARKEKMMCGPGRGSAAGSIVSFLLGITAVDPVEHGLLFERFINPARIDMPDIDCFPEGVMLETSNGSKKIQDISPGDFVLTKNGYKMVTTKHSRWYEGDLVILDDGFEELPLTPKHRVITNDDKKIKSEEICQTHIGMRILRECDKKESSESKILYATMPISIDLENKENLCRMQKGISGEIRADGLFKGMRICTLRTKTQLGKYRVQRRHWSQREIVVGSGFRKAFDIFGSGIFLRTGKNSNSTRALLHTRFLCAEVEEVCGNKGVVGAKQRAIENGKSLFGQKVVGNLSGCVGEKNNPIRDTKRKHGNVRKKISNWKTFSPRMQSMRQRIQGDTGQNSLFNKVCLVDAQGNEIWQGWSTRKDGTPMCHMWIGDDGMAKRRNEEVLHNGVQEQSVHWKEVHFEKKIRPYSGLVYNLTIEGDRHEYIANGILVSNCDFEDVRRQEIIEYLRQKYGADKVSQIATVSQLSGKQCIKDISRVLEIPFAEVNEITNSIVERSSGDERASQTIEDSFKEFKVCQQFNKKYPDVLKYARKLEGMHKNLGIHAAGVVTSPVPLIEIVPLEVRKHTDGDVVVTAIDGNGVQANGLLKLDILGLKTLAVLNDAVKAVKERHGVDLDLERLSLNLPDVLQAFTDHEYTGIFQYDSPGADKICGGVTFDNFEDIAAMTALNRPGTARSGLATEYVDRKKHPEKRNAGHFHPKVSIITADTLGVIVYQEHVQKIFTDIAGFPPATADSLRKKIAKKFGDETIGKERENFIRGAWEHSQIDAKTAGKIMDAITFFGSYGFNKCIASGTKLYRAGANGFTSPEITVKELFDAQNSKTPWGYKIRSGQLNVLGMCEDGRIRTEKLKAIYHNGIKDIYEVKTESGKSVMVTCNHKLLTSVGYRKAEEIVVGDQLVVMGDAEGYIKTGHQTDRAIGKSFKGVSGGHGTPHGDENPAWIDGRNVAFNNTKVLVKKRSKGVCEHCGSKEINGKGGHEFAHLLSFERCNGVYDRYHSCENIKFLCNSCHKKLDYFKGERKVRWSKGRPTILDRVIGINYKGKDDVYDVEMHGYDHNFIANGIVSHNSHATSYGIIAYWSMYLKVRYPLEFYWALLKNATERAKIQSFAKDAKQHGIELLPPDVSVSKREFAIDPHRDAIRGSLVDIKGCGESASQSIMENQPYSDFFDFAKRVEKRKVNRGVVKALAKAGALGEFIPNVKWFVENIEEIWKHVAKAKGEEIINDMLEASRLMPDWPEEERMLIASQVNPLAFGKHPIDAYADFIENNVKVDLVQMSTDTFWADYDDEGVYIAGVILEVKYNQIGDFHTGELPSESDRAKMFWGQRYANVNVEDAGGKQNRFKFDIDIFDDMRELIDAGIGTPVIVHAVPNKQYESLRAHFAIDLEKYRKKVEAGDDLNVWEKIIAGKHPAKTVKWKSKGSMSADDVEMQRTSNAQFFNNKTRKFTGIVMQIRFKYDKKDKIMAFFSMIDANGNSIDCICFASNWNEQFAKVIKSGNLLSIELDRQKDIRNKRKWQYFFNGGNIHLHKIS